VDEISINEVPDKVYYVGEHGQFSKEILQNKKMETAQYWANQNVQIGVVMLVSTFVLVMTLLAETDIFNVFWKMLWGF
jgi:hypothetical protein